MAFPNIPFLITQDAEVLYQNGVVLHSQLTRLFSIDDTQVIKAEYDFEHRKMVYTACPFPLKKIHQETAEDFISQLIPDAQALNTWIAEHIKRLDPKLLLILSDLGLAEFEKAKQKLQAQFKHKQSLINTFSQEKQEAQYQEQCVQVWLKVFEKPEFRQPQWL